MLIARRISGARSWGEAVRFDGSNDYLNRGSSLTGLADSNAGTISFWVRPRKTYDALNGGGIVCATGTSFDQGLLVWLSGPTGAFQLRCSNSSTDALLDLRSDTIAPFAVGGTYHVLASWVLGGTGSQSPRLFINDITERDTIVNTSGNTDWSGGSRGFAVGAYTDGGGKIDADIGEFWFDDSHVNIESSAQRRKFITAGGKPANLGRNGELVTGSPPLVYLTGPASKWNAGSNRGTGGALSMTGAVAAAPSFK